MMHTLGRWLARFFYFILRRFTMHHTQYAATATGQQTLKESCCGTMADSTMSLVGSIQAEVNAELATAYRDKAKQALLAKTRALHTAQQVVRNIEAEIADLNASIADGSFN